MELTGSFPPSNAGLYHFYQGSTILSYKYATRTATLADSQFDHTPIHAQDRLEELGHFLGFGNDVVPNQRAPKAIPAVVGIASMNQIAIKKKHIPWLHDH